MAAFCRVLCHNITRLKLIPSYAPTTFQTSVLRENKLVMCQFDQNRFSHTFLSRVTADQLWKGVTSVSNAGRKKGRGKRSGRRLHQDLNRGQVIGFGKTNMLWPGLNAPVVRGREVIRQKELPPDESREKRILAMRDTRTGNFRLRLTPLERGWCGNKLPGRSIGAPDAVGENTFEGFDSRVLRFRTVMTMSGQKGRVRRLNALVVVGNKNGLAGYGASSSPNGISAANNAKNRAAKNLRYILRHKDHTVLHDFHTSYGAVNIFVKKKPKGFGLVCHRVIREICKMVGITDIYAKCEGGMGNYHNITKAFFIGLMRQKTHEQLAEEKGLHVVEYRRERDNFPEVIASPKNCRTEEEIDINEITDFNLYINDGKVQQFIKPFEPFYINFPSYKKKLRDEARFRNNRTVLVEMLARYGARTSFLHLQEEEKQKQKLLEAVDSKE